MAVYHYDFVNGNNSNSGTELSPKQTIGATATLIGGDVHKFKRGVTWPVSTAGNRIGIIATSGTSASNYAYIQAYGDGAPPKFDGEGTGIQGIYPRNGSFIHISDLDVTRTTTRGIFICGNTDTEVPTDIIIERCRTYNCNVSNTVGEDGIRIAKKEGALLTERITLIDCEAFDNSGHGIKARIGSKDIKMIGCKVYRNGLTTAAHGMGAAGSRVTVTGWTLVSGSIYSATLTPLNFGELVAITSLDVVFCSNSTYSLLRDEGTTATPTLGAYSVPAANTLYVNVGVNPGTLTIEASKNPPRNVLITECLAEFTNDTNGSEGHGIGFDDYCIDCTAVNNVVRYNEGYGMTFNRNFRGLALENVFYENSRGGVGIFSPRDVRLFNNDIVAVAGSFGSVTSTSGGNIEVRNNVLVGGQAGLYFTNSTVDLYVESGNKFFNHSVAPIRHASLRPGISPTSDMVNPRLNSTLYPLGFPALQKYGNSQASRRARSGVVNVGSF